MKKFLMLVCLLLTALSVTTAFAQQDFVFGDALPDAPELAARGEYHVGVTTLELVNPDQVDINNLSETNPDARYDRPLTVEVWYPATLPADAPELTTYESQLGRADADDVEPFTFAGRAMRDILPDATGGPYPLVIVSHGFPGNRFMMSYLTENLASKGYVVAAIDHTDSTFADVGNFFSTLMNRARDQEFVLGQMADISAGDNRFLSGLIDADNTAIIGYSMGGYGALNAAGAGYNATLQGFLPVIADRVASEEFVAGRDPRIKAIVVLAPWGGDLGAFGLAGQGFWDLEALGGISVPSLWIAGSLDDVANYDAIVGLFDAAVNSDRYLLTYENALHNVAPNPPPAVVRNFGDYERYSEPAWDVRRINNINQHFITAFLAQTLRGEDMSAYLQPAVEAANDGVVALNDAGEPTAEHTYWAGFLPRTAVGMSLRYVPAGE